MVKKGARDGMLEESVVKTKNDFFLLQTELKASNTDVGERERHNISRKPLLLYRFVFARPEPR